MLHRHSDLSHGKYHLTILKCEHLRIVATTCTCTYIYAVINNSNSKVSQIPVHESPTFWQKSQISANIPSKKSTSL